MVSRAAITPLDIAVDIKQKYVQIKWQDGILSTYPLDRLRQACPCAVCDELRKENKTDPLRVLTPDQANATGELDPDNMVQLVGQYALQFFWADGHRTGIYTYSYLRELWEEIDRLSS